MTSPGRYRSLFFGVSLRGLAGFACVSVFCFLTAIASPAQTFNTLVSFASTNGASPQAPLVQGADGNFYGTTILGGNFNCVYGCGTVFAITSAGSLTPLYIFCTQVNCPDGNSPAAGLVRASDGNFYGTSSGDDPFDSGSGSFGTVFKISPSGNLTTLHDFMTGCQLSCPNGAEPAAGLIQGSDGNFYGTTQYQGTGNCTQGCGTVFKITPGGTLTTLHRFTGADGGHPVAALVQGTDGNFYGTTSAGGRGTNCVGGCGTVFKMSPSGSLIFSYSFNGNGDGVAPAGGLVQGSDGNFYGTTSGGLFQEGTVFKITPGGTLTTLHSFSGTDGNQPLAGLVKASDGNFYGTTSAGGSGSSCNDGCGTIFKITPGGTLTTLHSFSRTDGWFPAAGLLQATDGNFYGTTAAGGASNACSGGCGTVFRLFVGGSVTTVSSAPNPSTFGQSVTITATVGPSLPPLPTGTVSFTSNGADVAGCTSVPLNSGTAVCVTSMLAVGTDAIVASYSGDGTYSPSSAMVSQIVNPVPSPLQFVATTPCRVVDTRNPDGAFGGPPISGGMARSFPLAQAGNPCNIPSNAIAYSVNVTVVPQHRLGFLTIWPTGEGQPPVSTLNSPDGRVKANAAIVPAGTSDGAVSVYVTDTTNVILDIDGYFTAGGPGALTFYPLTPCRVVDTRQTNFPTGLGAPSFGNMETRDLPVLSNSPCLQGLPNTPKAYSFNVTVVPHPDGQRLSYLTIWPSDQNQPVVSTLNNPTATVVANAAIVPASSSNGDVSVFTFNSTDVIVDVNGYFASPAAGGFSFYVVTPCRVYDSRSNGGQPFMGEQTVDVSGSLCTPPASAAGYVFNATAVPANGPLGFLTLWPDGQDQPMVSTLNARDGLVTSNMAIVPNMNGSIDAYASALTQLILDISGYFAP